MDQIFLHRQQGYRGVVVKWFHEIPREGEWGDLFYSTVPPFFNNIIIAYYGKLFIVIEGASGGVGGVRDRHAVLSCAD